MSNWVPRTTAPDRSDPRWIQIGSGGYNECIYGSDGPPSVLPDCTGYVHGRIMEHRGVTTDNSGLSFGNGATYWSQSSADWTQSSEPQVGAVACYYTNTAADGQPGHVAIVEEVIDADTIIITESHYGGAYWDRVTCYRQYGWRPTAGWNVTPQGFLLNPYITPGPQPPEPPGPVEPVGDLTPSILMLLLMKRRKKLHGKRTTSSL